MHNFSFRQPFRVLNNVLPGGQGGSWHDLCPGRPRGTNRVSATTTTAGQNSFCLGLVQTLDRSFLSKGRVGMVQVLVPPGDKQSGSNGKS